MRSVCFYAPDRILQEAKLIEDVLYGSSATTQGVVLRVVHPLRTRAVTLASPISSVFEAVTAVGE